jgi:hypothetical protein
VLVWVGTGVVDSATVRGETDVKIGLGSTALSGGRSCREALAVIIGVVCAAGGSTAAAGVY